MEELPLLKIEFPKHTIDPHAYRIVETLHNAGFQTYLVGGCVRDLLLGRQPKDFDIGTLATPRDISRLFRNCRIIGRRFRLAHIHYGPEIYEVATFRGQGAEAVSNPRERGDAFIERTNTFGTPHQDALSRDFTMNGLFYDPIARHIIDYVQGYEDVEQGIVRSIGDPDARMEEDPVRILRAIKFSARLGFEVEDRLSQAMEKHVPKILLCPTPRVTEEIFRLGESRCALESFRLLEQYGALRGLLPLLQDYLDACTEDERNRFEHGLLWLDRQGQAHGVLPREYVLSALFLWPALGQFLDTDLGGDWGERTEDWFHQTGIDLQIPVRLRHRFYVLMAMIQRMIYPKTARRFRRARPLVRQPAFPQALALLRIVVLTSGRFEERYLWWRELAEEMGVSSSPILPPREKKEGAGGGRGRGSGGRRDSGRSGRSRRRR